MARPRAAPRRRAGHANHLIIMAKRPVAGRVKRRLGREIGDAAAIRFYRHCLAHAASRLAADPRWRTLLALDSGERFEPAPRNVRRLRQGAGDLGRRMQLLFDALPPGPAIIVGSDIPGLEARHVAQAFRLLRDNDAVLGPATDGGFWLVGLKRTPKRLAPFANIRWSTRYALADTVANLDGKRVALAATLGDVDSGADYAALRATAERLICSRSASGRARLIQP
jgi:rSAM/selenodomain-associated transferase 1